MCAFMQSCFYVCLRALFPLQMPAAAGRQPPACCAGTHVCVHIRAQMHCGCRTARVCAHPMNGSTSSTRVCTALIGVTHPTSVHSLNRGSHTPQVCTPPCAPLPTRAALCIHAHMHTYVCTYTRVHMCIQQGQLHCHQHLWPLLYFGLQLCPKAALSPQAPHPKTKWTPRAASMFAEVTGKQKLEKRKEGSLLLINGFNCTWSFVVGSSLLGHTGQPKLLLLHHHPQGGNHPGPCWTWGWGASGGGMWGMLAPWWGWGWPQRALCP